MKTLIKNSTVTLLLSFGLASVTPAQVVTMDDARTVAQNWITVIIHDEGSWGGHDQASVAGIEALSSDTRLLGYLCTIDPTGYILVPSRKELSPVRAYSPKRVLDAVADQRVMEFRKADLDRVLAALEQRGESATSRDIVDASESAARMQWEELLVDPATFDDELASGGVAAGYQPGTCLLASVWAQGWPYNKMCPDMRCGAPPYEHAKVGCVATAAAQVMRYWSWPPRYDWLHMPGRVTGSSDPELQDAIAELSFELGHFAGMIYGCGESILLPGLMAPTMREYFGYNAHDFLAWDPLPLTLDEWHAAWREQLDQNRPIIYGIAGEAHTVVIDGWKEIRGQRYWHLNRGWGGSLSSLCEDDEWEIRDGDHLTDKIIRDIIPKPSIGPTLNMPFYAKLESPYRYFEQDCSGIAPTEFEPGQQLQFLPGVSLTFDGPGAGYHVKFTGSPGEGTRLFSIKGTSSAGIRLTDSGIRMYGKGGLRFH